MKVKEAMAAIPMTNAERAKAFYSEVLGFELETLSQDLEMYWVKIAKSKFLLYQREEGSKAEHTTLSFTVENIEKALSTLESKGIQFYESKGNKIFDLDGNRSAWFKDTEGNNLEISERSKH